MPLKVDFMQRLNAGKFTPESSMTLRSFVEKAYLGVRFDRGRGDPMDLDKLALRVVRPMA